MKAIVLTFDCLPLRLLGCYGNQTISTPNFDRLAADSIVFDSHLGENFDDAAANHAWWTGRHQFPLTPDQQVEQPSIGRALVAAGVRLQMVCNASPWIADARQGDCWQTTVVRETAQPKPSPSQALSAAFIAETRQCLNDLPTHDTAAWLLWLKSSGIENAKSVDSEIGAIDRRLGTLLDLIAKRDDRENLLLVLTASKGADLGERSGIAAPAIQLCDSLVHVPLIIHLSNQAMGSRRNELTQSIDIARTLLDWFQVEPADEPSAEPSLLPAIRGESAGRRDVLYLGLGSRERAVRTGDFYYVETLPHSDGGQSTAGPAGPGIARYLFKKPDDQFDIQNLSHQFPEMCDELSGKLNRFMVEAPMGGQNHVQP